MKKLILTLALVSAASLTALAQENVPTPVPAPQGGPGHPPAMANAEERQKQMAETQAKFMDKQYDLTPAQHKAVSAACLEFIKGMDEQRLTGKPLTPVEFQKLEAAKDAKLKTILNKDQYAKYELNHKRPSPNPAALPPAKPVPSVQPGSNGQPIKN